MPPYRTQSSDTTREAEELVFERYRALEPHERLVLARALGRRLDAIALVGIRERHPDASEREQRLRLAALKYSAELMRRAFGWDPDVEGR